MKGEIKRIIDQINDERKLTIIYEFIKGLMGK